MENLISDKHASIDVAVAPETGFVSKVTIIFTEWSKCQHYSPIVIFFIDRCRQVWDRNNRDFLERMYLITDAKLCNMNRCECHIGLLVLKLYLVDISIVFFCI